MTPDLRYPNATELDPQVQWDIFKEQLAYTLSYPDSNEPDESELPSMVGLEETIPMNISLSEFRKKLYEMKNNEAIEGSDNRYINISSMDTVNITDVNIIAEVYQDMAIEEAIEIKPLTVFLLQPQQAASAVMIIPVELERDLITIKIASVKGKLETQKPALRRLQKYVFDHVDNTHKDVHELLNIPGIKRGSEL